MSVFSDLNVHLNASCLSCVVKITVNFIFSFMMNSVDSGFETIFVGSDEGKLIIKNLGRSVTPIKPVLEA